MLSILSLLLVTTALSVVMLLVLSSLRDSGVAGIREWGQANALEVMAILLFASRGVLPDFLSIEVANTCYLGSIAVMYVGFRRHFALPVPNGRLAAALMATLAGLALFHFGVDALPIRSVLVSSFQAALCVAIGLSIPTTGEPRLRYAFRFTRRAAYFLAICHGARVAYYGLQITPKLNTQLPFLDPSAWNVGFLAVGALALPALTLGAVMMANARVLRETAYDADHDHLTGAWSRRAFFRFAEREHARTLRKDADLSLLIFDADHFKRINDTHGHAVGDRCCATWSSIRRR
ncbi:GGDEF domain-containing protein [Massilia sp. Se16.2.3]|nr:GGDEF domain-containing protein [Massilia sp. Se16.2.3]QNB00219.1 GGDEF domain-containing protein [Massilia sp. Se16.2.3]